MCTGVDNKASPNHAVLYRPQGMIYQSCQQMIILGKNFRYISSKVGLLQYLQMLYWL